MDVSSALKLRACTTVADKVSLGPKCGASDLENYTPLPREKFVFVSPRFLSQGCLNPPLFKKSPYIRVLLCTHDAAANFQLCQHGGGSARQRTWIYIYIYIYIYSYKHR